MTNYRSIDLFSGCGGLSVGMVQAGFSIKCAIDNDFDAIETYKLNFPGVQTILGDVRQLTANDFRDSLGSEKLHLLAGCPPCQGFSSIRRLNKKEEVHDEIRIEHCEVDDDAHDGARRADRRSAPHP